MQYSCNRNADLTELLIPVYCTPAVKLMSDIGNEKITEDA